MNAHLESQGLRLQKRTTVDASIIEELSATNNQSGELAARIESDEEGEPVTFLDKGAYWLERGPSGAALGTGQPVDG